MKSMVLALATAACCAATAPALAADNSAPLTVRGAATDDPYTIRVSHTDLNLANAGEADRLRARVKQEAQSTCRALYDSSSPAYSWGCQSVAWRIAKPQIDAAIAHSGSAMASRAIVLRFARR